MKHYLLMLALALPALCRPGYAAWVPVDCKDRIEEVRKLHAEGGTADIEATWQSHATAVRQAKQGSPLYVPYPFPKNNAEIATNFRHAYFERLFADMPWDKLPSREQPVYRALKDSLLRIDVVRIENWGLSRCGIIYPVPYFYLLRLFDQAGKEVARSTQHVTGHMGLYQNLSKPAPDLPPLDEVDELLRLRFGRTMHAEQAQYVSVGGLPNCADNRPCIAFKAKGSSYLIDSGKLLYEIESTAPRKSVTAFRNEQAAAGLARLGAVEYDAPMVTLGFEWARARLIGGQKPK